MELTDMKKQVKMLESDLTSVDSAMLKMSIRKMNSETEELASGHSSSGDHLQSALREIEALSHPPEAGERVVPHPGKPLGDVLTLDGRQGIRGGAIIHGDLEVFHVGKWLAGCPSALRVIAGRTGR